MVLSKHAMNLHRTATLGFVAMVIAISTTQARAQHSDARQWNELLLESIRNDFARPTVHARNLYHVSTAMWDAWATYDQTAECVLFDESHATTNPAIDAWRSEALSYASYRIMTARFTTSPGAPVMLPQYDALLVTLGYNAANTTTIGNTPAAIGNRIAATVLAFGAGDNSNEAGDYANQYYNPVNLALLPDFPGNPNLGYPNRWQPLSLQWFIGQSGIPIPLGYPEFLSPEWGQVTPFALSQNDLTVYQRGGFDYWVYKDPSDPPRLDTPTAADYKWGFEMVSAWSSHLDPNDGVMIDISPGAIGNSPTLPGSAQLAQFYDFTNGGDSGTGHPLNPVTGLPYAPQVVPRGDYGRVLAEFWADGPDSETPPGHWFTLLNYVSDHPQTVKQIGGIGPTVTELEWDVKAYLVLSGAMHDCAVAAWGVKGWYDYLRPISALRYMADRYAVSPNDPHAITLHPGLIEEISPASAAPNNRHAHLSAHVGEVAILAWRGPDYIVNPAVDMAGVGWILASRFWPYQRPSFVTPPFAGYVSGHSTYSRAAAVVLDQFTGSPWFPGGLGEFQCLQNQFLVFEEGPSVNITLQWASYYDASDQCSLSRIWGGIHPPADDIPGREMGQEIGEESFTRAEHIWNGTAAPIATHTTTGTGCVGSSGNPMAMTGVPSARPVIGSTMKVDVTGIPAVMTGFLMIAGVTPVIPGFDLTGIGMPGCSLDLQIIMTEIIPSTAGEGQWSLAIPNSPIWLGFSIYHQAVGLDLSANTAGFIISHLGTATVGI